MILQIERVKYSPFVEQINIKSIQNMSIDPNSGMSKSHLTHQPLTGSQRTEQPSLWTCCLPLEELWDF